MQKDDVINRRQAIDKFEPWLKVEGYSEGERNMLKAVLYELTVMPSAQPERMKGRWTPHREKSCEYIGATLVYVTYDYWFCDTCGYRVEDGQPLYNFCPNCGADMRGREDERFDKQKDSN